MLKKETNKVINSAQMKIAAENEVRLVHTFNW